MYNIVFVLSRVLRKSLINELELLHRTQAQSVAYFLTPLIVDPAEIFI